MKIDAVLLIGPTGAGKSPLGDHIEACGLNGARCLHFDFGHQLRTIAEAELPPLEFTHREHLFIRDVLEKALLLEQEHFPVAEKIIRSFLRRKEYRQGDFVILNGLPRHVGQAADMESIATVRHIVVLGCTAGVVHARIRGNTGGDRTGRDDDDLALIEKKLRIFNERTSPLVSHYENKGAAIVRVEVTADDGPDRVYQIMRVGMERSRS
ncbi:MAG: nucleoside monophosphate kinase [Nitrospiraceae bacterium]|nr:nucleoside monophosphate kinase [Nitrospiraceae bacterium]